MNKSVQDVYDEIPYPSGPHEACHPGHIGAIALPAFGFDAAPLTRCRVLEIGGSDGGNLLPIAIDFPESHFACVDISPVQIEMGRRHARELEVENLSFYATDLSDFQPESDEKFDYIITHGVFSWVSRHVQDQLFAQIKKHLAPHGIGFVSYNTYPGWHLNMALRDMILFHVREISDPSSRAESAFEMLQMVASNDEQENTLKHVAQVLLTTMENFEAPLVYLTHEYLSEENSPMYFSQFCEQAGKFGLQVFGDAHQEARSMATTSESNREWIQTQTSDPVEQQQYLDFLKFGLFRHSLLCHDTAALDHGFDARKWASLFVASSVQAADDSGERWRTNTGHEFATTHEYALAILKTLSESWPASCRLSDLAQETAIPLEAVAMITKSLQESSIVNVRSDAYCCTSQLTERPCASKFSRFQIASGYVTSQLHTRVRMDDSLGMRLLPLVDGTRDLDAIANELGVSHSVVHENLTKIQRLGLLVS